MRWKLNIQFHIHLIKRDKTIIIDIMKTDQMPHLGKMGVGFSICLYWEIVWVGEQVGILSYFHRSVTSNLGNLLT